MAQYVLGDEGARKFKQLTSIKSRTASKINHQGQNGIDNYYATPFQVQWAQSSGEKDTDGKYKGTYIVWLPKGCLKVNGIFKENWKCKAAKNYNTDENGFGWFDLASMFDEDDTTYTEWPAEFSIWLDYSTEKVSFHFNDSLLTEVSRRILVARVINYNVIQSINSSIVVTDANMPFDIIKWNHESEPTVRLVRNWFYDASHTYTQLEDVDLQLLSGNTMNAYLVNRLTINDRQGKISSDYNIEFTKGNDVPEISSNPNTEDERNFIYWKKLYTYSGDDGTTLIDYRNAVVDMNWTGIDNNTISYGEDGQYNNFLHLANFYNQQADVGEVKTDDEILIRRGNATSAYLAYANLNSVLNKLSDELSDVTINVDEASISKRGELNGIIHMYDFHNENSNTTTMANSDIVLRTPYTSDYLSSVTNKLEYIPYKDFEAIINGLIEDALQDYDGGGEDDDSKLSGLLSSYSTGSFHYDQSSNTIRDGAVTLGRKAILVSGTTAKVGYMSLQVSLAGSGSATWVNDSAFNKYPSGTTSYIPVYQFDENLKIIGDYRGCFNVPCYDIY